MAPRSGQISQGHCTRHRLPLAKLLGVGCKRWGQSCLPTWVMLAPTMSHHLRHHHLRHHLHLGRWPLENCLEAPRLSPTRCCHCLRHFQGQSLHHQTFPLLLLGCLQLQGYAAAEVMGGASSSSVSHVGGYPWGLSATVPSQHPQDASTWRPHLPPIATWTGAPAKAGHPTKHPSEGGSLSGSTQKAPKIEKQKQKHAPHDWKTKSRETRSGLCSMMGSSKW